MTQTVREALEANLASAQAALTALDAEDSPGVVVADPVVDPAPIPVVDAPAAPVVGVQPDDTWEEKAGSEVAKLKTDFEDFFQNAESKYVPEAEQWFKLHSVQGLAALAVIAIVVLIVPHLFDIATFAILVLAACGGIFYLRLRKQANLGSITDTVEAWIKSTFSAVFDQLTKHETQIAALTAAPTAKADTPALAETGDEVPTGIVQTS